MTMTETAVLERRSPTGLPLLAVWLAAGAVACGGGPPTPVLSPVPETSRLFYDDSPTFQDSVRVVVRDDRRFAEVWSQVTGGVVEQPRVDFGNDLVIVVAAGQMTPEDQIRVESVGIREEGTVDLEVQEVLSVVVVTRIGCGRFRSAAYPREIVRVRHFDGPVRFDERIVQDTNCGQAGTRDAVR